MRIASLLIVAAALAGCGGGAGDEVGELARADGPPLYYLGDSFEELPLTHVERQGFFVYGECGGDGGGDKFHCTKPQVQLQHFPLARRHPSMFEAPPADDPPCARDDVAGRPVAAFVSSGGLEVYVGERVVVIFADSPGRTLRAVHALQALRGPNAAAPPTSVPRALERCSLDLRAVLGG